MPFVRIIFSSSGFSAAFGAFRGVMLINETSSYECFLTFFFSTRTVVVATVFDVKSRSVFVIVVIDVKDAVEDLLDVGTDRAGVLGSEPSEYPLFASFRNSFAMSSKYRNIILDKHMATPTISPTDSRVLIVLVQKTLCLVNFDS
jgi:CTP:molybdopterin cytidylyltransferase MocA